MQKLNTYFETIGFSGVGLERILSSFSIQAYVKGDYFVEEGKISKYLGFVDSGLFQYFVWKDGEERTTYVSIENTWLASLLSFIGQTPSLENVKAITDGKVYLISREALKELVDSIPGFKDFYIGLLEGSICGIDASRHDLIVLSGDQRYEKMLRQEPHLLQRIPLQYLASMLGVTPRHLSRIRRNTH
jgi:CRP/FNR family transcriptional regulator, anaerobic regulatory protein